VEKFLPRKKGNPEEEIRDDIKKFLECRAWFVKVTHGNMFQSGFPDLFACHAMYGTRWIEVKNPKKYAFTTQQLLDFPQFVSHGCGIWVMVGANEEEYQKLFKSCNWYTYLM
jgi:hypothetical protein